MVGRLWRCVLGPSDNDNVDCPRTMGGRLCDCCNVLDDDDNNDDDNNTTNTRSRMICLELFRDKRQSLPCLHGFHADCFEQCLLVKWSCPICRVAIGPSPTIPMTIEE